VNFTCKLAESLGTDLSSRGNAATLRRELCAALDCDPSTTGVLDFEGVRTVSSSFADELVAVLVSERGEGWFKSRVRILHLTADIRNALLEAVSERLDRRGLQPQA
jgi:hypothetical protein